MAGMMLRRCEAGRSSFVCTCGMEVTGTGFKSSTQETTLTTVVILSCAEAQDFKFAKTGMSHEEKFRFNMSPLVPVVCTDL